MSKFSLFKKSQTLFLKSVVTLIGVGVLAICVFVLPVGIRTDVTGEYWPILLGLYIPAIPFFFALYQTLKLLGLIDRNKAFSLDSITSLRFIKYCALLISAFFSMIMPYVFYVADKDDAPGVVLMGLIIIFASIVIATFAAVLQKLVQSAHELQSENELTV